MVKLRLMLIVVGMLLSACGDSASPAINSLNGTWQDSDAEFTTCEQTYAAPIKLRLEQTDDTLTGTFTLDSAELPFEGKRLGSKVSGVAKSSNAEAALIADLEFREDRLAGTFTAAQSVDCTAGGTSTTVYSVTLEKQ